MPYSKDIRSGSASIEINVNAFFQALEDLGVEVTVSTKYPAESRSYYESELAKMAEEFANEYIHSVVFKEEYRPLDDNDLKPSASLNIWDYVWAKVFRKIRDKPFYVVKNNLNDDSDSESDTESDSDATECECKWCGEELPTEEDKYRNEHRELLCGECYGLERCHECEEFIPEGQDGLTCKNGWALCKECHEVEYALDEEVSESE